MKRSKLFTGLAATAALATIFGSALIAVPAQATPQDTITATGSDTTELFMEEYLNNPAPDTGTGSPNAAADTGLYNLKATYGPDFANSNEFVPSDANCSDSPAGGENGRRYAGASNGPIPPAPYIGPPNGSGNGKTALNTILSDGDATNNGCFDIARSSSARGGSDPATFEYYGYGMDVLSWATASANAPVRIL